MRAVRSTARFVLAIAALRIEGFRLRRVTIAARRAAARQDPKALARVVRAGHRACDRVEAAARNARQQVAQIGKAKA